jgi:helicase
MSGRAGRPGYDKEGYSYLIGKTLPEAEQLQYQYIYGDIEATNSRLLENRDAVFRQIISQVAAGMAKNLEELLEFFKDTFSGFQMIHSEFSSLFASDTLEYQVKEALDFLMEHGMIQAVPDGLRATAFGMLIAKSNYTVQTAVRLKEFARSGGEFDMSRLVYEICRTPDLIPISLKVVKAGTLSGSGLIGLVFLWWMWVMRKPLLPLLWSGWMSVVSMRLRMPLMFMLHPLVELPMRHHYW